MVTARRPLPTRADRLARAPGPEIFQARMGSLGLIGVSTTRLPSLLMSAMVAKEPSGLEPFGQSISLRTSGVSGSPKLRSFLAMTMVSVWIFSGGGATCATGACWLASQVFARKTARLPKSSATRSIIKVPRRTGSMNVYSLMILMRCRHIQESKLPRRVPRQLVVNVCLAALAAEAAAEGRPLRRCPVANLRQNDEADGKDNTQKCGVFDEGRATVISVKRTEERNNRFHFAVPVS